MDNKKIFCIGEATYETTIIMPNFPIENQKYIINEKIECGGGTASNCAYMLGKWGMEAQLASIIGYDTYGTRIKTEMKSANVKQDYLETNYEMGTEYSLNIINSSNITRTVFNLNTLFPEIRKLRLDFTPNAVFMDGNNFNISKETIKRYENSPGVLTFLGTDSLDQNTMELAKLVKYLIISKEFAEGVTNKVIDFNNPSSISSLYIELKEKFKNSEIVVTLKEKGALYSVDNSIKIMPAINIEAKDVNGAGDVFNGAFVFGIINGYSVEKSVAVANIAAGLSVRTYGTRVSIPPLDEVIKYYEAHIQ